MEIFGHDNMGTLHWFMYKYLKNLILKLFGPKCLKQMMLDVEKSVCSSLRMRSNSSSVELKEGTTTMIFDLTVKKLISYEPSSSSDNLRNNLVAFILGLISFPLDIPDTAYH